MAMALATKSNWSDQADEWFAGLEHGAEFTSENLIRAVGLPDTRLSNANNAVGAKMRALSTQSEEVGYRKSIRITSHSRRIIIWRKK